MLSTPESDVGTRYLLGELDEEAQREVEERYFADDRYFDELLRLEEDLLGQDVEARIHSLTTGQTPHSVSVTNIERLPEIEFTRQWLSDVRELIASSGQQEEGLGSTGVVADDSNAVLISALIDFYEAKLRQAELNLMRQETESLLAKAWQDRLLASAMMEEGWLGLRLLNALESGVEFKTSNLAAAVGSHIDVVTPVLIRLVQSGGVDETSGLFSITERGARVIANLEIAVTSLQG